jgi:hypothetical protein
MRFGWARASSRLASRLPSLLSSGGNVSTGILSALRGIGDNRHEFQISAPVQPGNSGGPATPQKRRCLQAPHPGACSYLLHAQQKPAILGLARLEWPSESRDLPRLPALLPAGAPAGGADVRRSYANCRRRRLRAPAGRSDRRDGVSPGQWEDRLPSIQVRGSFIWSASTKNGPLASVPRFLQSR